MGILKWVLIGGAAVGAYYFFLSPKAELNRTGVKAIGSAVNPFNKPEDKLDAFEDVIHEGAQLYDRDPKYRAEVQERARKMFPGDPKKQEAVLKHFDKAAYARAFMTKPTKTLSYRAQSRRIHNAL